MRDPFPDLDQWLADLADLDGVRSAVVDPVQLITPGVWCKVPSLGLDTFAVDECRLEVELYLAVADADWRRARANLMNLLEAVLGHLGNPRVESARFVTLALPGGGEVPALLIPTTLRTTPDPLD